MPKEKTSYRLSETCNALLGALADDMGSNRTAVIEFAVRDVAKRRKIGVSDDVSKKQRGPKDS